ncbi:hypothetical protein ACP70R_011809 [Stipagrostis hirtigluma subsp. patula]
METQARAQGSLNIDEEYKNTLRTQSNVRFLSEEQRSEEEVEALLESQQDLVLQVLQNMVTQRRSSSEIKRALAGYFDASAEAAEMCQKLLTKIKNIRSNYQSMESFLARISDGAADTSTSAPNVFKAFPSGSNPFGTTTRSSFRKIHDKCSHTLQSIKSSHRRVARKHKILKAAKKISKTSLVMACSAAAIAVAAHPVFFSVLVGPAAAGLIPIALKTRITASTKKRSSKTRSLLRLQEQLDAAAKGTFVLGRDLDTVSQLVERLSDGIDRENAMARYCVKRMGERSSVLEMASELRKSCSSTMRLAEELEEHLCLCLATIYRARVLVLQEISKQE